MGTFTRKVMLKGHTIFITGASRGIGKALAVKCAKDGANVAVFAKSGKPHPTLPGTIYTAAEDIEAAGGNALPLQGDIRYEEDVQAAVDATVKKFGGIDILVINARGTYLFPAFVSLTSSNQLKPTDNLIFLTWH